MPLDNNIEIRNDEVQEILGNIPVWIVRWGTSLIVGLIVILVAGSWIFKSPAVIHVPVTITTENPPARIVARSDGKIESLFVGDREKVGPGQILAVIENPANFKDVWKLKSFLDSIDLNAPGKLYTGLSSFDLGEIQTNFESFKKSFETYWHFMDLQYHPKKSAALNNELGKLNNLRSQLIKQNTIIAEDMGILRKQHNRDSILFNQGVISELAMDQSKANLLQKELSYHESLSRLSEIELEIARLQEVQIDNQNEFEKLKNEKYLQLKENFENLNAEITIWENKYVLRTPIAGEVSFFEYWSANQYVVKGNNVMMVIPHNQGRIIGKIQLNQDGAGKVQADQKVIIKLRNYPYLEYGVLEGKVLTVSSAAENDMFSVFVQLNDALTTNYGTKLEFAYDMEGSAEIITQDIRLIDKLINPIKSVLAGK